MHAALFLVMSATLGVDVGWQPLEDGGFEYIIQIEPQSLEVLRNGDELRSDIPPFLRDVRSYRIRAGNGELPRIGLPSQTTGAATSRGNEAEPPPPATRSATDAKSSTDGAQERYPRDAGANPLPSNPSAAGRTPRDETRYPNQSPPGGQSTASSGSAAVGKEASGDAADQPPRILDPDPSSTELVGHASSYREGLVGEAAAGPSADKTTSKEATRDEGAPQRWWPLTGALLMLFVSVGGNAYLGMQWWSVRQRCQELMRQLRGGHSTAGVGDDAAHNNESGDDEDADVRMVSDSAAFRGRS